MTHIIAGQRFDTDLIPFRMPSVTGPSYNHEIRYRIEVAGMPIRVEDFGPSEAGKTLAVVDEVLEFVANRINRRARE